MIGLLSKNTRAKPLFSMLTARDPRFVDIGIAHTSIGARAAGLASSIHLSLRRTKLDAQFSPVQCRSLQRSCERALGKSPAVTAVVYWGATNQPTSSHPYFIISDGPFDPGDASYPPEWVPDRWAQSYLAQQRKVYREAAHVFTLSAWAAEKIRCVHGINPQNVTPIGWGPLHYSSQPTLVPAKNNYFVSIGSAWECKGMDILATAGELLHRTHAESSVVLAGDPRGFCVRRRSGVTMIPKTIPGAQAQELISHARALLVGSRFDASPHVIMEAFQAGTPVIASRVCGIPEVVTPGMGYLVDAGDPEGFASAMRSCLEKDVTVQRARVHHQYLKRLGGWSRVAQLVATKVGEVLGLQNADCFSESGSGEPVCARP